MCLAVLLPQKLVEKPKREHFLLLICIHVLVALLLQKLVEKLKRERFRAIYDYLCRGARGGVLNLVEVVLVGGWAVQAVV